MTAAWVAMYNPALPGSPHVLAPVRAQALYAAHGWLVVDGTTPVPTNEFLTPFAGDLRYLKVWTPNEVLTAGAVRVAPDGHVITRNGNGTARATYDTTEQALWTAVSGGGGGAVSSVAGRTGAVTLASTDLTDSTATGQALVSAATAAAGRTTLGLGSAATQASSAFDTAGAAAAVLPTQTGNSGKFLTTNGTTASWGTPSGGGPTLTVATTATSAATLVAGKHTPVDATSAALTMPLPTGAAAGTFISAEKFDSTANAVTLSGSIRGVGSSTVQLVWAKEALLLVADSAGSWWPVAGHKTKASLDAAYGQIVNPAKYGFAAAASGATNTAALASAVAELAAAGGGTLAVPPGTYDANLSITTTAPILVMGWGATFRAYANGQSVIAVSQANGSSMPGCAIRGIDILANGFTSVIGADVSDTDGAMLTLPNVHGCAVGVRYRTVAAGKWVERCSLTETFIRNCDVGVEFLKGAAAMPSFNECAMRDVGITSCTLGIAQRSGADFTRTTWANVTVWVTANQTGVLFDGRLDYSRLTFGVESFSATGTIGIQVGANFTNYADAWAHDLEISLVGSFANKVVDSSTGGFGIVFTDGRNINMSQFGAAFYVKRTSEGFPRLSGNLLGFDFGDGTATPDGQLRYTKSTRRLEWNGRMVPATGLVLKAPNGSEYVVTVGNDGALTTTLI